MASPNLSRTERDKRASALESARSFRSARASATISRTPLATSSKAGSLVVPPREGRSAGKSR
jgi:hypothetical protein